MHCLTLTRLVAMAAAGMLLIVGILRAGFLADMLSRTVLVGFLSGVGLHVAFSQSNGKPGVQGGDQRHPAQCFHAVHPQPEPNR